MPTTKRTTRSIYLDFKDVSGPSPGGGAGVNQRCAETLRSAFATAEEPTQADLRVKSFSWEAPVRPRRLFIDHGSFADASFWAISAQKLRVGDTILVSSRVCIEVARKFIQSEGPPIVCVPFPVDTQNFKPVDDRGRLRLGLQNEHGIPVAGPLLLVVSAFIRRKNQHLAIHLLERLLEWVPDTRLAFVGAAAARGSGEAYQAAVQDLARRLDLSQRVHFLGELPHCSMSRLMAASDLLVHFTNCRLENFGLVVGEAMASGLPVVAADWGGLRDLVVPGETGVLAPTYLTEQGPRTDWLSVVQVAAGILGDVDEWKRLSRNGRARVEQQFHADDYRRNLCAAVEEALARPGDERSLTLTEPGAELMFRTLTLNATHPEIKSTGDEFRLLMTLDSGKHYRMLAGPAASSETAPKVEAAQRLYPVVTWAREGAGIRITDPAWPASLPIDARQSGILERCDGERTLERILEETSLHGGSRHVGIRAAQALVDQGVLCPLGCVPLRPSAPSIRTPRRSPARNSDPSGSEGC